MSTIETRKPYDAGDEIRLADYSAAFRKAWWKVVLFAVSAGLATLFALLRLPNIYRATAVINPIPEDMKQNPAVGALASLGIPAGGPTKVEDLELLFKSDDLTVRVFRAHDLWQTVLGDAYDPRTGTMTAGRLARLGGGDRQPKPPGDWDAVRAARERLNVSVNKRSGAVTITFDSPSAEGSANIVRCYLEEGKSRLQEEALDRANRNKRFIAEQIGKTVDVLTRDRLYALYGQEVEREMLARNRDQFGFRLIDAPRAPDRKIGPRRAQGAVLAFIAALFVSCGFVLVRGTRK